MKTILATAGLLAALSFTVAEAAHNNPWATSEDSVDGKNHEANQGFSLDRPGEDEMNGVANSLGRDSVTGPKGKRQK